MRLRRESAHHAGAVQKSGTIDTAQPVAVARGDRRPAIATTTLIGACTVEGCMHASAVCAFALCCPHSSSLSLPSLVCSHCRCAAAAAKKQTDADSSSRGRGDKRQWQMPTDAWQHLTSPTASAVRMTDSAAPATQPTATTTGAG